jgi:subtilisin family serine protease
MTVSLNVLGTSASSVSNSITASDPQGLPLTFSIAANPTVGTASLNASSGSFTYSLPGNTSSKSDSFTVTVSNGKASTNAVVTVQLMGDPLLVNQWHIQNLGNSAFASVLPAAGNDMNVAGAWAAGFTGRGVRVGVVDSGLEVAHEDLAANVDVANSFNFVTGTSDPTRATNDAGFDHGTSVAGIIGAVAFNNKGGRGVAYNARLRGYNLIANFSDANYAAAMGGMAVSSDNAIFNASFGTTAPALPPIDSALTAAAQNLQTLRGGLGAVLVNAAGNDFEQWESAGAGACALANRYHVSCGDPMHDTRLGGFTPLVVGALNADGVKSSYSSAGSALWVSAPGGEFGLDSTFATSSNPNATKPAIVTTNRNGCGNTIGGTLKLNSLDSLGANPLAQDCQYTAAMNGTSSATPNTSGAIALMLEANPNLGWRDIKYILAKTARHVDPNLAPATATDIVAGQTITLEQGWVKNAAGYSFSNWYGFGGVDASAAVAMAKSYTNNLAALQTFTLSSTPQAGLNVPPLSTTGFSFAVPVTAPFTTVEHVVIFPNIDSTPAVACNQIELVSPSGTKAIILHAANGFAQTSATGFRILANAFYGEPVNGTWTLTFYDYCANPTVLSATLAQTVSFVGH